MQLCLWCKLKLNRHTTYEAILKDARWTEIPYYQIPMHLHNRFKLKLD